MGQELRSSPFARVISNKSFLKKFHLICRQREHLTEEKQFHFGHCPNYLSPPGQAADGGSSWMSRLAFSIPHSVEVVRVACRPAFHIRQKVSKMRKGSPWLV